MHSADLGLKVLYVEDDRLNIILMEEVFRDTPQWELLIAETGAEALQCVQDEAPALLLVDMNLPDMNGLQLLQALRLQQRALPLCIALSADALPEQVAAARAAGFADYWLKPIDVPALHTALQTRLSTNAQT
ncbi:MAG: response regulator [Burkholderiaceae bacterium]|nr:response regulator [Burkholderiaceae bacterium]